MDLKQRKKKIYVSQVFLHPKTNLKNKIFILFYIQFTNNIHYRCGLKPTFITCIENQGLFISLSFYLVLFFFLLLHQPDKK